MFDESRTYSIFHDELHRVSPQKLRPKRVANTSSGMVPAALVVVVLSFRHAIGIGVLINPLLHVAVVTIVPGILGTLLGHRRTGIVALRGAGRRGGIVGFQPRDGVAAKKT